MNAMRDRVSAFLHRCAKGPDPTVRVELTPTTREALALPRLLPPRRQRRGGGVVYTLEAAE
jgi:hypothetical protein